MGSKSKTEHKVRKEKKEKKKDKKEREERKEKEKRAEDSTTVLAPTAPEKQVDPALASLFESSFGAVEPPRKRVVVEERKRAKKREQDEDEDEDEDEEATAGGEDEDEDLPDADEVEQVPEPDAGSAKKTRKRKRREEDDDLEGTYLRKLADSDEKASRAASESKKAKTDAASESGEGSGSEESDNDEPESAPPILHESLAPSAKEAELEKSSRTIFLGNVPSNAISSKTDYKVLKRFFSTPGKIESVRFRSVAFSEQIPRKAAFVNHKLHEKQKTANAYVVYKEAAAAREALKLNGSVVLDRHIRVDSVAHPAKSDSKRCIFIGNLDFEAQEEDLWRHFGDCGKVESVRVVRDSKTNVGKGFAYVQFEDAMSVDQALLLDGKKMSTEGRKVAGDRKLRVTRAKSMKRGEKHGHKKTERRPPPKEAKKATVYVPKADPKEQALAGRASKLLGRAGASILKKQAEVFEGLRATTETDSGVRKGGAGGGKRKGKPRVRTTARSSAWKKGAVKK